MSRSNQAMNRALRHVGATLLVMLGAVAASAKDAPAGVKLPPFENINVYPLIAEILGLKTGAIDGRLRVLEPALRAKVPAAADSPR